MSILSGCTALLFQPTKSFAPLPDQAKANIQEFYFESFDKTRLHGWYLPARVNAPTNKTVLFLHGNAGNISSHVGGVYWLGDYGVNSYIFDYRGYGRSEGTPFLEGILLDIDSAIKYVLDEQKNKEKDQEKIWIIGHSMGASLGTYVIANSAVKNKIAGFISVSAFSDYRKITRDFLSNNWISWLFQWPLSLTINNDYSPNKFVQKLTPVPLYLIHGLNDPIIDLSHSRALFQLANQPKEFSTFKAGHNDIFANKEVMQHIKAILETQ